MDKHKDNKAVEKEEVTARVKDQITSGCKHIMDSGNY